MTDFVYVNDLPIDDTPSADARALFVNEVGTELVQGPTWASNRQVADGRYDPTHGVAGPVVWDTINRADDASGLGAADSGQAWSNLIGVVGVDGLRADWVSSPGAVALATTDAGMTNYRVEADVNAPNTFSTSGVGVAFGVVDADNYLSVVTRGQDNGHLRINKTVAGVTTQLAEILTLSPPIVIGDWYRIVADKRGDLIVATLLSANGDALHTVSATLSGADETTFGSSSIVGIWLRSSGQLRNFAAYPSSGTPITTLYGAQDASGASSVTVPVPTAVGHAARTTAIGATTGRMAINGCEMGDTGWRDVSSLLATGWTAEATFPLLRRIGNIVHLQARGIVYGGGGSGLVLTLPTGFLPDGATVAVPVPATTASGASNDPTHCQFAIVSGNGQLSASLANPGAAFFYVSFASSATWPTSLPGTAVATATTRPGPNPNLRAED